MAKVARYDVYVDSGRGWKLRTSLNAAKRKQIYDLVKSEEQRGVRVKVVRITLDEEQNSRDELVEYISDKVAKESNGNAYMKYYNLLLEKIQSPHKNIYKALIKTGILVIISFVFAIVFVNLLLPILANFDSAWGNRFLFFFLFCVVFLALIIPLISKNIPWQVFIPEAKQQPVPIKEQHFFEKAEDLIKAYNINNNSQNMITGSYPEAGVEYKQYLVYYLGEILANLNVRNALQKQFSRMGVKLLVFGGCLELSRYGKLKMTEANSLLYEAFRIIEGQDVNLEDFYEAKRSFSDNKTAIYLMGIGAFLMHQAIDGQPLYSRVLNKAFEKWEELALPKEKTANFSATISEAYLPCLLNIKSDLKFLDSKMPDQEQIAENISMLIRNLTNKLSEDYAGFNIKENSGATSIEFYFPQAAVNFAHQYLQEMADYLSKYSEEKLILRTRCVIVPNDKPYDDNTYIADVFEHVYNNEIVVLRPVADVLTNYENEYLGSKVLESSDMSAELYKLKY